MSAPYFSVIMPVYGVEKYLRDKPLPTLSLYSSTTVPRTAAARYAMRLQPRTAGFGLSIRRKTAERAAREISAQSPLRANISIIWIPTIK